MARAWINQTISIVSCGIILPTYVQTSTVIFKVDKPIYKTAGTHKLVRSGQRCCWRHGAKHPGQAPKPSVFIVLTKYCHDDVMKWKHFPRYWPFVRWIHRWIPHKGRWRGALDVFFDLHLNKRLSKQSWGWWFETLSRPLRRHCNALYWTIFRKKTKHL